MDSKLLSFLKKHIVDEESTFHSHTSLEPRGKYLFSANDMDEFWDIYQKDVINNTSKTRTITEKSDNYLPVLADIDIKIRDDNEIDFPDTLYSEHDVIDLVTIYQDVLRHIIDDCTDTHLICVVLEKPLSMVYDENKDVTTLKRGLHLHFPYIFLSKKDQREQLIPRIKNELKLNNIFKELGIKNSADLLDDCHLRNPWLLYGSCKGKDSYPYKISKIYNVECEELSLEDAFEHYKIYDWSDMEKQINIRENIEFYLPSILSIVPHNRPICKIRKGVISPLKNPMENNKNNKNKKKMSVSVTEALNQASQLLPLLVDWRATDRNEWMNIGWCLYNISEGSDEGLKVWLEFSERDVDKFDEGICQNEWEKMTIKEDGLSLGTLKYLAQLDNNELYVKWKNEHSKSLTKNVLESGTNYNIALMLYEMYGTEFRYDTVNKMWYHFSSHIWRPCFEGADLRDHISTDIVELITTEYNKVSHVQDLGDKSQQKSHIEKFKMFSKIVSSCQATAFKNNVMTEAQFLFRDEKFAAKLNSNKYLIAFKNGVYDLKNNYLRSGKPDDYISKCMNLDYSDFTYEHEKVKDVENFLEKVFPDKSVRNYFIDSMSDVFEGGNKKKIVIFWTGEGDNGKSVTQNIMEQMLGPYAIKFPTTLVTGKKVGNGCADPNLARAGDGVRWAILEEPDKTEELNIGLIKQLTGDDSFNARDLFQKGKDVKEIKPLFKLVFICNSLPVVRQSDKAFWNRVKVIPFESTFVRDEDPNPPAATFEEQLKEKRFPRDENFGDKIPDLLPAFAWYLLEHRKLLVTNKKKRTSEPEKVRLATISYQKTNDIYRKYIDECIIEDKKSFITSTELHNDFKLWYRDSNPGSVIPTRNEVEQYFTKIWGAMLPGLKWKGYRKKTLDDELKNGDAIIIEEEDLVSYDKGGKPPL